MKPMEIKKKSYKNSNNKHIYIYMYITKLKKLAPHEILNTQRPY